MRLTPVGSAADGTDAGVGPGGPRVAVARRRDERREGHPHRPGEQLYHAKLDCFVDLGPEQKGAHMSRFEEVVNDVIGEVVLGEGGFKAEQLAQRIAVEVRERQGALRAEVTIAARYPEHKPAPVSGIATQEIYTLLGTAVASERGTRRLVGVAAQGMTACPCAQQLVADALARAPGRRRVQRRRDRRASSRPCRSRRMTSAASARSTSGCPRSATPTWTRRSCSRSSRTRCPARSTS